jgi:hypothetical protein
MATGLVRNIEIKAKRESLSAQSCRRHFRASADATGRVGRVASRTTQSFFISSSFSGRPVRPVIGALFVREGNDFYELLLANLIRIP